MNFLITMSISLAECLLYRRHSNISWIELIDYVKIITNGRKYEFMKRMFSYKESKNVVRKVLNYSICGIDEEFSSVLPRGEFISKMKTQ